jgi:tetratricopeptide (TPR) repeat protein
VAASIVAVALVATLYPTLTRSKTRHLLVLPFNCPGADVDAELLCSGLLDTVTAKLAELRRFRSALSVVPASEVRGQGVNNADIAHRVFGVDLVVSGSVLRENAHLRIPIELVDASQLRQIRSHTITTEQTADFILQDRVIAAIEEMLDVELGAAERRAMMVGGTQNAEAAELFLEARGHARKTPTEIHLTQAMTLYRQALEIDPEYVEAMVQLADACDQRYQLAGDSIWLEHGANYAQRAVSLAPDLPAAQFAAGRFALANSTYEGAIEHLKRAIALDPLGVSAYMYLAQAYQAIEESELADETVKRAIRTGPEDWRTYYDLGKFFYNRHEWERAAGYFRQVVELLPESSVGEGYNNLATLEFYEGGYAEAAELYERALEMDDTDFHVWNNLAEASRAAGNSPERVRQAYEHAAGLAASDLSTDPDNVTLLINLASFAVHLGDDAGAREHLARVEELGVDGAELMFFTADAYERLGERARALDWVRRALEAGFSLQILEDYHDFDALRADPRFAGLAAVVGAEQ